MAEKRTSFTVRLAFFQLGCRADLPGATQANCESKEFLRSNERRSSLTNTRINIRKSAGRHSGQRRSFGLQKVGTKVQISIEKQRSDIPTHLQETGGLGPKKEDGVRIDYEYSDCVIALSEYSDRGDRTVDDHLMLELSDDHIIWQERCWSTVLFVYCNANLEGQNLR